MNRPNRTVEELDVYKDNKNSLINSCNNYITILISFNFSFYHSNILLFINSDIHKITHNPPLIPEN